LLRLSLLADGNQLLNGSGDFSDSTNQLLLTSSVLQSRGYNLKHKFKLASYVKILSFLLYLSTSNELRSGKSTLSGSTNDLVLCVLVIAGGGNVFGLEHQSSSGVGDSLGQAKQHLLQLPAAVVFLSN
jgi:hypothetical protein